MLTNGTKEAKIHAEFYAQRSPGQASTLYMYSTKHETYEPS